MFPRGRILRPAAEERLNNDSGASEWTALGMTRIVSPANSVNRESSMPHRGFITRTTPAWPAVSPLVLTPSLISHLLGHNALVGARLFYATALVPSKIALVLRISANRTFTLPCFSAGLFYCHAWDNESVIVSEAPRYSGPDERDSFRLPPPRCIWVDENRSSFTVR